VPLFNSGSPIHSFDGPDGFCAFLVRGVVEVFLDIFSFTLYWRFLSLFCDGVYGSLSMGKNLLKLGIYSVVRLSPQQDPLVEGTIGFYSAMGSVSRHRKASC